MYSVHTSTCHVCGASTAVPVRTAVRTSTGTTYSTFMYHRAQRATVHVQYCRAYIIQYVHMTCVLLSTVVCSTTSLSNFVSPGTVHRYSWYFNSPGTCTARLLYQVPSLFFFFRYRAKQCLISNCSMYVCEIHFLLIWLLLTTNYMANNTGKVWH